MTARCVSTAASPHKSDSTSPSQTDWKYPHWRKVCEDDDDDDGKDILWYFWHVLVKVSRPAQEQRVLNDPGASFPKR